ncbi:bifunctional 5,10-methylene-tetrahydrofolate dehydrogenase/5,10-methylene-tetrahydrofolate cyclohydrolase, partial [PVC group bacterium]|nr:bifunctional 5,10-methylene-tetrahydrofolate dehydrogenase/5,10-methylene-tetrahydrofolate cyclohydrolase [PVC group bacterium]
MSAKIIDGKAVKQKILEELKSSIAQDISQGARAPGLAVVLVGDNPASEAYIRMKKKACADIGIQSFEHLLKRDVSEEDLEALLRQLNGDKNVHGILLQLPLPKQISAERMLET